VARAGAAADAPVSAVARLRRDHRDLRLLLVGPNSGNVPLDELPAGVVHAEFLELHELALLYRAARALVLPTVREGFGHPVAEAMASGCAVVLPRNASVGVLDWAEDGARAELVAEADDVSPAALERTLRRVLEDDELRARVVERARVFAAGFPSWDEHARVVMDELAEAAS
jgi:alpha-1,3-rhamnosyl/mannosyltransferase